MIDVTCSHCGTVYHSDATHVGKQLRCVQCGNLVSIAGSVEHAVMKQSPAVPDVKAHTEHPPSSKRRSRVRIVYRFAIIATVVVAAVLLFVLLRYQTSSQANTVGPSDLAHEATQSQQNQTAENSGVTHPQQDQTIANNDRWQVVGEEPNAHESTKAPMIADERPTDYRSLPTGTRIEPDVGINGHGTLTVRNGTSDDAVVRLSDMGDHTVRWFFVKAHSSARTTHIPEGTYRLTFTTGLNWVAAQDGFSWHPSYREFERTFEYTEQHDSEGVQYDSISVTLNPVLFGNIRTRAITREEFLRGHRHLALPSSLIPSSHYQ